MHSLLALVAAILAVTPAICQKESRIINGNLVDTLRRFPHYVTIKTLDHFCAGSIVSDKWILTSLNCVREGEKHEIVFRQRNVYSSDRSFSIIVPHSAVTGYPTGADDIALIRLPIHLVFDNDMKPIKVSSRLDGDTDFVVMPGLDSYHDGESLAYGMFALTSKYTCKKYYGNEFDEYLQLCTMGWRNNNQAPCDWNEGAGLITGWPREPRLIGIFSRIGKCSEGVPAIFINVSKYRDWMISVTGADLLVDWNF